MKPSTVSGRGVRFGVYEVDLQTGELRKRGLRLRLQEKPFQILARLLEHPGEMVTREELRQALWPADTFVDFDNSLNAAINKLREALGDSADHPRYVETLPRRGYRFIYPVEGVNNGANGAPATDGVTSRGVTQEPGRRHRWGAVVASVVGLAAVLVALGSSRVRDRVLRSVGAVREPPLQIQSIAVLPLTNLSGDPGQEYFSDGMTDALITELAQMGSLKVISRTSSMQYKQTRKPLPEIVRELNVDGIVEGTVQRSSDRVRITAQLIQGSTDKHLWANSYERELRDVFVLEREVAGDIARHVQARFTTQNQASVPPAARQTPLAQPRPVNPKVLEAYLQGDYHLNKMARGGPWNEESREAQSYFQQAIDADPSFAPAYVGLANAYTGRLQPSIEDRVIRRKLLEKAVALDPTSSEAHAALAESKCSFGDWDWPGAEEEYRRAIALNPNNAAAHDQFALFLDSMGRLDEGWGEWQIAQQLDPNQDHLCRGLWIRHQNDRAVDLLLRSLRNDPDNGFIHFGLFLNYAGKTMHKEEVQELERAVALFGFPEVAAIMRRAYATSGYRGAMQALAKQLEHLAATNQVFLPIQLAETYTALGDKDRAFYWLEQAYTYRDRVGNDQGLECLKIYRRLDPLRSDPRFKDLVRRVGLPP